MCVKSGQEVKQDKLQHFICSNTHTLKLCDRDPCLSDTMHKMAPMTNKLDEHEEERIVEVYSAERPGAVATPTVSVHLLLRRSYQSATSSHHVYATS